jgi:hypothetical protein
MGWDVTQVGSNITTRKFLEYDLKRRYDKIFELVKIQEGKNEYGQKAFYVALKKIEDGNVFACVVLTRRKNGSVAIKIIGESEGPTYYEASESFIKVLGEPQNLEASWWRNRCLEKYQVVENTTLVG